MAVETTNMGTPLCGTLWSGRTLLRFQRIVCPDDGGSKDLRSLGGFLPYCTASCTGRRIFMLDFRFRVEAHENCVLGFLIPEDGTGRFSRNVGKILPLLAA
jgi:hypothetical protein